MDYRANYIDCLSNLMREKGVIKAELAREIKCDPSKLSKALNPNRTEELTLAQIIFIAEYFNISIDEMVGRSNDTNALKLDTVSDVLKIVFDLYDKTGFQFGEIYEMYKGMDYIVNPLTEECEGIEIVDKVPTIYFRQPEIYKALKIWRDLLQSCLDNHDTDNTFNYLFAALKEKLIKDNESIPLYK